MARITLKYYDVPQVQKRYIEVKDEHWDYMKKVLAEGMRFYGHTVDFGELDPEGNIKK